MNKTNGIGAFEANEENFLYQLWQDIQPFTNRHKNKDGFNMIFFSVCDYLETKDEHWLWTALLRDNPTEEKIMETMKYFCKQLEPFQYKLIKPIKNSFGETIDYEEKKLIKDKMMTMLWINEYKTSNGIKVRTSNTNYIALKGVSTKGVFAKMKEFNNLCNDFNFKIDELTLPQLEKFIIDWETDPKNDLWKAYPSLSSFEESYLVENDVKHTEEVKTKPSYKMGVGYTTFMERKGYKDLDTTLDVFDFE